ncbi:MAG TPA: hypothetical protein VK845_02615 [Gemmatimonadales bacterium]|nr:hypothetical protein [Gemmatimonadales bacterium]
MDANVILTEAAVMFGKHAGTCDLTPDGAAMFSRVFDLTVRPALAANPEQWESPDAGRSFALGMIAHIGAEAARLAGPGRDITAEILRRAANKFIDRERRRLGIDIERHGQRSVFCFCYLLVPLFEPGSE